MSDLVQMNLKVPPEVRESARSAAQREGRSISGYVADAVAERSEPPRRSLTELLDERIAEMEAEIEGLYAGVAERIEAETGGPADPLTAEEASRVERLEDDLAACRDRRNSIVERQAAAPAASMAAPARPSPAAAPVQRHPVEAASLSQYMLVASAGRGGLSGAEAELNAELGLPEIGPSGGVVIPAVVLAATSAGRARLAQAPEVAALEPAERARAISEALRAPTAERAVTTTQSTVGPSTPSLSGRVFAPSVVDRLGVTTLMQSYGQAEVDVITSGSTPAFQGENPNAAYEPAAATLSTTKLTMVRLTAGYDLTVELQTRLGMLAGGDDIEGALMADMTAATGDILHDAVVDGSGVAPVPKGIWASAIPTTEPDDPTKKSDAAAVTALFSAAYDGVYAGQPADVMLVTSPAALGVLASTVWDSGSGMSLARWAAMDFGGVIASSKIGVDAVSPDKVANGFFVRGSMMRDFDSVLATWDGLEVVRDPYSDARSGVIKLTMHTGYSFAVLRADAYDRDAKLRY